MRLDLSKPLKKCLSFQKFLIASFLLSFSFFCTVPCIELSVCVYAIHMSYYWSTTPVPNSLTTFKTSYFYVYEYFICLYVCIYTCACLVPQEVRRGCYIPGNGVMGNCGQLSGYWEPNHVLCKEQPLTYCWAIISSPHFWKQILLELFCIHSKIKKKIKVHKHLLFPLSPH